MLTMWCGVNATMFDGLSDIESIHEQILAVQAAQPNLASVNDLDAEPLLVGTVQYPAFPPHDLRSPARQGVAIGAARIGGRHRPVDVIRSTDTAADVTRHPWAIPAATQLTAACRRMPAGQSRSKMLGRFPNTATACRSGTRSPPAAARVPAA